MVDRGGHRIYLIIRKIATFRGEWFGVSELAERVGLSRSTVHHQLAELVAQGIIEAAKGKYRNRYCSISLLVTVESITARLQEQGIEPSAEVLAAVIAHMREAASCAAYDALDDFICEMMENSA